MRHTCHAINCAVEVKPEMLMCLRHWRMVPKRVQERVWATYRAGQCDDMNPSRNWHIAADAAIHCVQTREKLGRTLKSEEVDECIKFAVSRWPKPQIS